MSHAVTKAGWIPEGETHSNMVDITYIFQEILLCVGMKVVFGGKECWYPHFLNSAFYIFDSLTMTFFLVPNNKIFLVAAIGR
jgi:hypothetical protein